MAGKTVTDLQAMRDNGEPIVMITAYDHPMAQCAQDAGVDIVFIGDSMGTTVLGHTSTIPVTMDDMVHHTKAVARSQGPAHILADLPFLSYQISDEQAMANAARLVQEGGAQSVKLEGGREVAGRVRRITEAGIPVMGHLGLTPQSVHQIGSMRMQARTGEAAQRLLEDALALEAAGAYAVVFEAVPWQLAQWVTARLRIPTIGIGAGPGTSGQVLVLHDLLGLNFGHVPKFVRPYADLRQTITNALAQYGSDVRHHEYPSDDERYAMKRATWETTEQALNRWWSEQRPDSAAATNTAADRLERAAGDGDLEDSAQA